MKKRTEDLAFTFNKKDLTFPDSSQGPLIEIGF